MNQDYIFSVSFQYYGINPDGKEAISQTYMNTPLNPKNKESELLQKAQLNLEIEGWQIVFIEISDWR